VIPGPTLKWGRKGTEGEGMRKEDKGGCVMVVRGMDAPVYACGWHSSKSGEYSTHILCDVLADLGMATFSVAALVLVL